MYFYQVFIKYCNKKGVAPTRAALDIGLSKTSCTHWASGSVPSDANIAKLAEYFEVDLEQFREEIGIKKEPISKTDELESEIVDLFKQLRPDEQGKVLAFVQGLLANRAD